MNEKLKKQSNGLVNVYYAVKPKIDSFNTVYPKERQIEIENCQNLKVKKDKYFVWKLLEQGLIDCYGLEIKDIHFSKNKSGKWESQNFFFSLSHSEDIVAVAISNKPVGLDVEIIKQPKVLGLENKIFACDELDEFNSLSNNEKVEYLIKKWTQKESKFKMANESIFKPKEIICDCVETVLLDEKNKKYFLSIATDNLEDKKIIKIEL